MNPDGSRSDVLLFYKCGNDSFLAAVNGYSVMGRKPDVAGWAICRCKKSRP